MKPRLTVLCAVLIALAGTVHAQTPTVPEPSNWLRYTVKDEAFSLTRPATQAAKKIKFIPAMKDGPVRLNVDATRVQFQSTLNANGSLMERVIIARSYWRPR